MKFTGRVAALLALTSLAGAAYAQDIIAVQNTPWKGFYAGGNIGGAWNHTCQSWEPGSTITGTPGLANAFYNRDCPSNGSFIGGIDLGYNMQIDQWVFGFKADYDAIESKTKSKSVVVPTGAPTYFPAGTYTAYGKSSPNGIFLLGPRVGYAIDQWLPYFRIGGAFASGQHTSNFSYTAPGDTSPSNYFSGGKNYKSSGGNVGFGVDYDLQGPWSFTAEYNYVKLGKGTNSTFACNTAKGTPPSICTNYANFSLDSIHNSVTLNMFRVGFHYAFNM
jgi:outer membrane immunogenic protein